MFFRIIIFSTLFFTLTPFITFSQVETAETTKAASSPARSNSFLKSGSIDEQFDYLMKRSEKYKIYRLARIEWLNELHKNITDSLRLADQQLLEKDDLILRYKEEIEKMGVELSKKRKELTHIQAEKDGIAFLGISIQKSTYQSIMIFISISLLVLTVILLLLFKNSNSVTSKTKTRLKEVEEEFEVYRRRAVEREQKIARQLHVYQSKEK